LTSTDGKSVDFNVYVINLDRRSDRLNKVRSALAEKGLNFIRVSAVDGAQKYPVSSTIRFLSPGSKANWDSMQSAFSQFLSSQAQFALVLEDDADVASSSISEADVRKWIYAMKQLDLSLLQVGFISHLYKLSKPRGLLDLLLALRRGAIVNLSDPKVRVVLGEFRAGAHAFIVDRPLAEELLRANQPPYLASDNFLESLARHDSQRMLGRLFSSAVEQESRIEPNQQLDSDI